MPRRNRKQLAQNIIDTVEDTLLILDQIALSAEALHDAADVGRLRAAPHFPVDISLASAS
jgi:hypothetical protein